MNLQYEMITFHSVFERLYEVLFAYDLLDDLAYDTIFWVQFYFCMSTVAEFFCNTPKQDMKSMLLFTWIRWGNVEYISCFWRVAEEFSHIWRAEIELYPEYNVACQIIESRVRIDPYINAHTMKNYHLTHLISVYWLNEVSRPNNA